MNDQSVYEIRAQNLTKLVTHYKGQSPISKITGVSATIISRTVSRDPGEASTKRKRMGERLARRFEEALQLPRYWMDSAHEANISAEVPVLPSKPGAAVEATQVDEASQKLTSIQRATRDTLVKLMDAGKLPDSACLKLLQAWQPAVEELESEGADLT